MKFVTINTPFGHHHFIIADDPEAELKKLTDKVLRTGKDMSLEEEDKATKLYVMGKVARCPRFIACDEAVKIYEEILNN